MKSLTTETALDILIAWLQDNIDCESGIIFDNDEDKTDSAALLPCHFDSHSKCGLYKTLDKGDSYETFIKPIRL